MQTANDTRNSIVGKRRKRSADRRIRAATARVRPVVTAQGPEWRRAVRAAANRYDQQRLREVEASVEATSDSAATNSGGSGEGRRRPPVAADLARGRATGGLERGDEQRACGI
ncbi:hypothetical protein Syun_012401 [Stephania yunnanensis]|uniref:Uncharacterized protein n=1 Tax=Stephania yunnanensis TaxID=152371 RepID=A0AAP0JZC5_9MAGN